MLATVTGVVPSMHSAFPRRVVRAAALVLAALAVLTTVLAQQADASVNRWWPHRASTGEAGGKCIVYVGYNLNSSGRFIGSGEVHCDRAMHTISMKVTLFRAGSPYVASAWTPRYGVPAHIVDTPGACGGHSSWVARANVYIIRPDGSPYSFYRDAPLVNYDPPC